MDKTPCSSADGLSFNLRRIDEVQGAERHVHRMTRHVADRTRAEIQPAAPDRTVHKHPFYTDAPGPGRARHPSSGVAEPGLSLPDAPFPAARWGGRPEVDFAHRPDDSGLNTFDGPRRPSAALALVAHLGDDAGFLRQIAEVARLVNGLRQRLLAIDVFAQPHGMGFGDGVEVIRRGNGHGVNVLADLVKHDVEIR